jgi:hypothetical protein
MLTILKFTLMEILESQVQHLRFSARITIQTTNLTSILTRSISYFKITISVFKYNNSMSKNKI